MPLPVCGHENIEGEDDCENCGADLRTVDVPAARGASTARSSASSSTHSASRAADGRRRDRRPRRRSPGCRTTGVDCLLVVEGEPAARHLHRADAVLKLAGRPLDGMSSRDVMTPDPVVLRHDDTVAVAIHKMAVGGFRHIPIVEDGRLSGSSPARDVFGHLARVIGVTEARRAAVVVLADDLIWATRLARCVEAGRRRAVAARGPDGLDAALAVRGRA